MVALMLTDEILTRLPRLLPCLLMGKFRCINAERLQGDPLAEHYFDCWDDAVCPGAAKTGGWIWW